MPRIKGGGGRIILRAIELVRSSGLFEVCVCSNFGSVRSLSLREIWVCSTPPTLGSSGYIV